MSSNKWFWPLLAWIGIGTFLCHKYCCNKNALADAAVGATSAVAGGTSSTLGAWSVKDGAFGSSSADYYRFLKSKSQSLAPAGAEVDKLNAAVGDYIKGDGKKGLNVIGYYKADEVNDNTFYENLGLARANNIKQQLIALGIPAKQITTSALLLNEDVFRGDTLMKGGDYGFFAIEDNASKLSELKTKLQANPIILYFKVNSNELDLSAEQQKQFSDLIYYMDNVADAGVEVSGHTDNDGGKAGNIKLSQERADFVKAYLNSKGNIVNERMDTKGYGPSKPIADNKTPEGKAQNRRVEVILK
jgi:OmpA-OmpF porin, OOP family